MATVVAPIAPANLSTEDRRSTRWRLPVIVLAALAIRLVVVFFCYRDLPDADKHYEQFGWEMGWIARALASGHGFSSPYFPWSGPTAIMSPLYPGLLSLVFRIFGIYSLTSAFIILAINSVFSALTCVPVYFSAKYSLGERGAKYAAWVWALYPFAIYFSATRVWEYALTSLLFTTCFCIAQRIHRSANPLAWIGWGTLYGITAHSNASIISTLPFLLGFALYRAHRADRRWVLNGALALLAFIVVLTPWTVRNYRVLGVICPIRDNIWLEMYADNFGNAPNDRTSPPTCDNRPYPASSAVEMNKYLTMGEVAYLAEKHALSIDDLKHRPHYAFLAVKTLRRVVYYWTGFWSFSPEELHDQPLTPENVFHVSCITLFMLLGIRRLWRVNRIGLAPYLLLIGAFPITYYLTHPMMDYREPIEPAVVVLATAGAMSLRLRHGKSDGATKPAQLQGPPGASGSQPEGATIVDDESRSATGVG
jgi:4-amino-4-deoxy-L-arabinose transferase-like glycosyltransferase